MNGIFWWRDAIFYQIWVASFQDSNHDGIGDLRGVIQRIPYLKALGINAIWLTPIFTAPTYHGYGTTNYFNIDKRYGTDADFKDLLNHAHHENMHVVLDLVLNHVSNQHEWFHRSEISIDTSDSYGNYFVWKSRNDIEKNIWSKPWMPLSQDNDWQSVWHLSPSRLEKHRSLYPQFEDSDRPVYFYGVFGKDQPDLNYEEPAVHQEVYRIAQYWLDVGVDGFRLDGASYLYEETPPSSPAIQADSSKTLQFWREFSSFVKTRNPTAFLIAEVWNSNSNISRYCSLSNSSFDAAFDFTFGNEITLTERECENSKDLGAALAGDWSSKGDTPLSFFSPFLTNHDQLRIAYQINENIGLLKAFASALMTWTGTPFIYYGEEIGMTQPSWPSKQDLYDDVFKRAPMIWGTGKNGEFSSSDDLWIDDPLWVPWCLQYGPWWNNFLEDLKKRNLSISVESQLADPHSLLNHYRKVIAVRKERRELRASETDSIAFLPDHGTVALFRRKSVGGDECYVAINPTSEVKKVRLIRRGKYVDLLSGKTIKTGEDSSIRIQPFETFILALGSSS